MSSTQHINANVDERRRMIAEAAYDRAMARGFANGDDVTDWLAAEREVDARLSSGDRASKPK